MTKSATAAIAAMLLVTSAAWGASPEGQAIRPTGDNQPDPSPTEQANQANDPVPVDEERYKGGYREKPRETPRDVEQQSLREYNNPEAAGDEENRRTDGEEERFDNPRTDREE